MFGNLGGGEIALILILALLLFGAKRLPEVGRSLGRGIREFKLATREITSELDEDERPRVKPLPRDEVEPRSAAEPRAAAPSSQTREPEAKA